MDEENKYLTSNGHLLDEYISLYVDAQLLNKVKELPLGILEHVEDCLICKQNIIEGYEVLKNIKDINVDEHPYFDNTKNSIITLKNTNFFNLYKIAASVIIIVSLGVIGYYTIDIGENSHITSEKVDEEYINDSAIENITTTILSKDSVKKKNEKENTKQLEKIHVIKHKDQSNLIAKNELSGKEFQVSPIMLTMLGENTRADFLKVKVPKDSTIFKTKQTINFSWESNIDDEIILKVFNYKEELIFESEVLVDDKLKMTEHLLPGAYIWKIESVNEMFHLGLFFIKK